MLAGYPKEILLLEQICWRGQTTGGELKYTATVNQLESHFTIFYYNVHILSYTTTWWSEIDQSYALTLVLETFKIRQQLEM